MSARSAAAEPRRPKKGGSSQQAEHDLESTNPWRRFAAEFVGTFLLTWVAAGAVIMATKSPADVGPGAKAVAPALVVLAMIYAVSDVSGAHFNPAVTFAFALRGDFRWRYVPGYWSAQLVAAIAASALLRATFGTRAHVGATVPHAHTGLSLLTEVLLTFALVTVILGTATRAGVIGPQAAIAVGSTIVLAGLVFGPVSGASMNPARSLGPAIVGAHSDRVWIYVVGPILGAVAAVGATWIVHGPRESDERQAAEGEGSSG
jgi:aquaporin Z